MMQEHMHEKLGLVSKRRDQLRIDFEQGLKKKEEHYKQRMAMLRENRRKQTEMDLENLNKSKIVNSDLGLTGQMPKERAKTAVAKTRAASSLNESSHYFEEDEEEEELQRKLEEYESMLRRAENLR